MANARITAIAAGVTAKAKDANGVWRTLADGDEILDGEEVKASTPGPQFGLDAYEMQRRVAGVWSDALTIELNAGSGSSHWRQDKYAIAGDGTDSTVGLVLQVAKGSRQTAHDLVVLQVAQTDEGGSFEYPAEDGAQFKGLFSALEQTSNLEMGGFQQGIEAQIVTDRQQWVLAAQATGPIVGQELLWHDGQARYRIVKVEVDEISFVIGLASVNK